MKDIEQKIADLIEDGDKAETEEEHNDVANKLHDVANELHKLRECALTIPKGIKQEYASAMHYAFQELIDKNEELSDLCSDKEDYFIACAGEVASEQAI